MNRTGKKGKRLTISPEAHEATGWMPFPEAREFVRKLNLGKRDEWYRYVRGERADLGVKPENIPSRPDFAYRNVGWRGWGDWIGSGNISPRLREYLSYDEAREYVKKIGIKTQRQYIGHWQESRPFLMPREPEKKYRGRGWISWGHFLRTKRHTKNMQWRPFKEAREYVRGLKLKSAKEYYAWCSGKSKGLPDKPTDIPVHPHVIYKDHGWYGYGDFLGTAAISTHRMRYLDFESARKYVQTLKFKTMREYTSFWNYYKPSILPKSPHVSYRAKGWKSWADFLGYIRPRMEGWRGYEEAKRFVHRLGLKSQRQWISYCGGEFKGLPKKPDDIPSNPYLVHAGKGWKGWSDWIGSDNVRRRRISYRPYDEARKFSRALELKSGRQWKMYVAGKFPDKPEKPEDIPATPDTLYRGAGWISWKDFLGQA